VLEKEFKILIRNFRQIQPTGSCIIFFQYILKESNQKYYTIKSFCRRDDNFKSL